MTREESLLLSAYTGLLTQDFSELQKFCEETLGRPVLTHEFADKQILEDLLAKLQTKLEELIRNIDKPRAPTREQVEKMRGEWILIPNGVGGKQYMCSKCGVAEYEYWRRHFAHGNEKFCSRCGSPMTDEAVDMMLRRWKEAVGNGV